MPRSQAASNGPSLVEYRFQAIRVAMAPAAPFRAGFGAHVHPMFCSAKGGICYKLGASILAR